jgi:AcrR family transcriptional regulator
MLAVVPPVRAPGRLQCHRIAPALTTEGYVDQASHPHTAKRAYHSRTRQQQAEATRQRMLAAARDLFARRGYAATTLEAIAEIAGVSPKTVAAGFGSKRALLAEAINPHTFGSPVKELIEAIGQTRDPARRLALVAQIARQTYEPRAGELELLRMASAVAPELAELAQQVEARRRQHQSRLVAQLHERAELRPGLVLDAATDAVWALTSYDLYRKLVVEQGWEPARYEAWLAQLLGEQMLAPGTR